MGSLGPGRYTSTWSEQACVRRQGSQSAEGDAKAVPANDLAWSCSAWSSLGPNLQIQQAHPIAYFCLMPTKAGGPCRPEEL